jgi:hypothetical protein
MDVAALRNRIQSTLDANADIRRQAELDLKYAETQPGFINALLDILQGEQVNAVQLSGTFCRLFTSLLKLNRSPSALWNYPPNPYLEPPLLTGRGR